MGGLPRRCDHFVGPSSKLHLTNLSLGRGVHVPCTKTCFTSSILTSSGMVRLTSDKMTIGRKQRPPGVAPVGLFGNVFDLEGIGKMCVQKTVSRINDVSFVHGSPPAMIPLSVLLRRITMIC